MWFLLAVISYFLLSLVVVLDKYFLEKHVHPRLYTFYASVSGIVFLGFIPFGFFIPSRSILILNFAASATFVLSLYFLYRAFKLDDISRIISSVGALTAVFIYFFNYLIFNKIFLNFAGSDFQNNSSITGLKILGLSLLLFGFLFFISNFNKSEKIINEKTLIFIFSASVLSASFFILTKLVYRSQPFISGFIWLKIGIFLCGLFFLLFGKVRREIKESFIGKIKVHRKKSLLFIAVFVGKLILGGIANILQSLAISFAPFEKLAVIKALEGTEYFFVFVLAVILTAWLPHVLSEEFKPKVLSVKIIGLAIVASGIIFLHI